MKSFGEPAHCEIKNDLPFFEKPHLVWHFRSFLDWCQILLELQGKSAEYHFERRQCTNSQMRMSYLKIVNNWVKLDQKGSNWFKLGLNWIILVQNRPKGIKIWS